MSKPKKYCSVVGCGRKHRAKGLCAGHYNRSVQRGAIVPTQKRYATPEESFANRTERRGDCLIWIGSLSEEGYSRIYVDGSMIPAHRWVWERSNGSIPAGLDVDHRHHCDPACVELAHLRLATRSENNQNRSGAAKSNKSTGVRNVYKRDSAFTVVMQKDGRQYYFGSYGSLNEASRVAAEKRQELFGEFAGRGEGTRNAA